jgi:hypothetical protein
MWHLAYFAKHIDITTPTIGSAVCVLLVVLLTLPAVCKLSRTCSRSLLGISAWFLYKINLENEGEPHHQVQE